MKRIYFSIIFLCLALCSRANTLNEQLWQAIIAGNEPLSIELLRQGADINSLDAQGFALMHRYASADNEIMIKWLYDHGADVNVKDFEGSTPIFYAELCGSYRLVYLLIQLGAEIKVTNQDGMSPKSIAEYIGSILFEKLLDNPKNYQERPTTNELYFMRQEAMRKGELDKAISLAQQEIKQAPHEWTKSSPYYTRGITDLGMLYTQLGRFKEAEHYINKAIHYWKKTNPNSEQYYFNLTSLAFLKKELNQLEEALTLLNICAENINSFSNEQVKWQIYLNRADIQSIKGDYTSAENDYQNALECVKLLHKDMQFGAWSITYGNRALMHLLQNTPESLKLYENELFELIKEMEARQLYDQNYLRFKQQLCVFEEEFGSIDVAEENVIELVLATKTMLGAEHDDYIVALNLASEIAAKKNKYADAYSYLSEALDVITHRKEHASSKAINAVVDNWAGLLDLILEDESSLWAHNYAYDYAKETYGESSGFYLQKVSALGDFWYNQKKYDLAIPYLMESYKKNHDIYGENSIVAINSEYSLWHTYAAIPSKRDSAYVILKENDVHVRNYVQNMFGIMSEQQREQFWEKHFSSDYSVTRPAFLMDYASINPEACGVMYNDILFTRGLLLNSNDSFSHIVANSKDSLLQKKWQRLLELKSILNSSQAIGKEDLRNIEREKDELERNIMRNSDVYRLAQENFTLTWQDVQKSLKDDEVAIEFTINTINHWGQFDNKTDSVVYYALVLRKGDEHPALVPLFERDELNRFYANSNDRSMYDYEIYGNAAYKLIWEKLLPYCHGRSTIFFAPTHALSQIALEAIPVTEDSVFGDYYKLHRLTSTREILKYSHSSSPSIATLYGGISYDVSSEDMLAESERYVNLDKNITRSVEPLDTLNRGKVSYLPGTKREVEQIQQELIDANCSAKLLTGSAANEESFISLSGKENNVIHLATHGFFWWENVAKEKDIFKQAGEQDKIDPLARCGLLFSGANMALQGHGSELPSDVQDGVLTAREISSMDLRACDMAVLSACATGVGEYSEDGTLGLQRAFKQAGVRSLIMTLWPVNDSAAQLMMTEFYRNWITNHQSKREAFRNAQNTVRHKYVEPEYWAGFIMLD